jgi:hypothetical protein
MNTDIKRKNSLPIALNNSIDLSQIFHGLLFHQLELVKNSFSDDSI